MIIVVQSFSVQAKRITLFLIARDHHLLILFTLYAVATQGALIANSALSHDSEVTTLAWQPSGRVIAVGWADGTQEGIDLSLSF